MRSTVSLVNNNIESVNFPIYDAVKVQLAGIQSRSWKHRQNRGGGGLRAHKLPSVRDDPRNRNNVPWCTCAREKQAIQDVRPF